MSISNLFCLMYKIVILLIFISSVSCFGEESEEANEIVSRCKSKNGKYISESFRVIYGQKGITKVFHLKELVYIVNEYSHNALISNDGKYLVLFNRSFEKPLTENELANTRLFSIYKEGSLISEYKLKDLFAFNSDVKIRHGIVSWLAIDLFSTKDQESKSIQISEEGVILSTVDGFEWLIDPLNGKIKKKTFNIQSLNLFYNNDVNIADNLNNNELENFKKIILDDSKYEFSNFKMILDENNKNQFFFECQLRYFVNNHHISINITVKDFESLNFNLPLVKKAIKAYIDKNSLDGTIYRINCYLYDLIDYKISGISMLNVNDNPETLEFLNNSFMVREVEGFEYLDIPYLIKSSVVESSFNFTKIKLN